MLVATTYLGSLDDPAVRERVDRAEALNVTLTDAQRRRSRVRTTATDGTDLGIKVPDVLADGDVLLADGRPVVVSLEAREAMVLAFADGVDPAHAAALGHAVGNRHWDLAAGDGRVRIPVVDDRDHLESVLGPLLPEGTTVAYEAVPPETFDGGHSYGRGQGRQRDDRAGDDGHTHSHHTPHTEEPTDISHDGHADSGADDGSGGEESP